MAGYYQEAKIKIPGYIIHGTDDELFNTAEVKSVIDTSNKKSKKLHWVPVKNYSHYMACSYVSILQESAIQLLKQLTEADD